MRAQIRYTSYEIKVQIQSDVVGNKSYGYSLSTKVPPTVLNGLVSVISENMFLDSLSKDGVNKYAPCEIELVGDKGYYKVTIVNGDRKLCLGFGNMPFEFDTWFSYASGDNTEKCPKCHKKYKAIIKGGTVCDCVNNICDSCGGESKNICRYKNGKYCDSCFYDTFCFCDICGKVGYKDDATYYRYDIYCEECFLDDFVYCENCDNTSHKDDISEIKVYGSQYTQSCCCDCYCNAGYCKQCGDKFIGSKGEFCSELCEGLWQENGGEMGKKDEKIAEPENSLLELENLLVIDFGLDDSVKILS